MRNLTKETLAKNLIVSSISYAFRESKPVEEYNIEWLNAHFPNVIASIEVEIQSDKKRVSIGEERLRRVQELYEEYSKGKHEFVVKYYKKHRPEFMRLAKKYPTTYRTLVQLLDKLVGN